MKYQWHTYERSWHKKFIKEINEVHIGKFILEGDEINPNNEPDEQEDETT